MTDIRTDAEGAPFSLYLQLEEGARANLDVVARTSLAFVELVREVAFIIDPTLDVRVELQSGTEGSLSLNALIKDIKGLKDPKKRRLTLLAVAGAILLFLGQDFASWVLEKALDEAWGEEGLTDEEKEDVAEIVRRVARDNVARPQREQVFQELERDPKIIGVGGSPRHDRPPAYIIPREEFGSRGGGEEVPEIAAGRVRRDRLWVTLVSPVLTDAHRRWKFGIANGEYGVYMEDHVFLADVLEGRTLLPMLEGIELDVTIDLHEEHVGGDTWTIAGHHTIVKVHGMRAPGVPELPLFPRK